MDDKASGRKLLFLGGKVNHYFRIKEDDNEFC